MSIGQSLSAEPGPAWDAESEAMEARSTEQDERERAFRESLPESEQIALARAEAAESELQRILEQNGRVIHEREFLLDITGRLLDRLAGARMLAGDMNLTAATAFVNAERAGINEVLGRMRG